VPAFQIAGAAAPHEVLSLASEDVKVLGFVSDERLASCIGPAGWW